MKFLTTIIITVAMYCLLAPCASHGQETAGAGLPEGWNGSWKGACTTTYTDGRKLEFTMGLHVAPIEGRKASKWTITYESDEMNQTRDYEIIAVDLDAGHFRIDEQNSIVLDIYLIGNTLHSRFQIGGQNLESMYRLGDAAIEVNMVSSSTEPAATTGGENGIPEVASFKHLSAQSGMLKRVK